MLFTATQIGRSVQVPTFFYDKKGTNHCNKKYPYKIFFVGKSGRQHPGQSAWSPACPSVDSSERPRGFSRCTSTDSAGKDCVVQRLQKQYLIAVRQNNEATWFFFWFFFLGRVGRESSFDTCCVMLAVFYSVYLSCRTYDRPGPLARGTFTYPWLTDNASCLSTVVSKVRNNGQ